MARTRITSHSPWEPKFGYCRAIRVRDTIAVTGSTAVLPDGRIGGKGDAYAQARAALEVIRAAIEGLGASMSHVVRTRMYVTDMKFSDDVGRAHGEVFGDFPPATSMVQVVRLIHPDMLVEIEADAIL